MINKTKKEKLDRIYEKGINPYPNKFDIDSYSAVIKEKFKNLENGEHTKEKVSIAGRIMQNRIMGKAAFMHLLDTEGRIQLYFRQDDIGKEEYKKIKLFDIGDIIGVKGTAFKTKTGEVTIHVDSFEILTKSLAQLPEKWHGLKDQEIRYRKRYIDLISNPEVFELFKKRTDFVRNIRKFMEKKKFIEVETPVLEAVPGGADARPFITHHNTLDIDFYLRISLELHLKRLIVGGYERVFEIGKVFRNEGISTQHLQEFTLLEFYYAYIDYNELMDFTQELIQTVTKETFGTLKIKYQDKVIDFEGEWPRIDYTEIIKKKTGIDLNKEYTKEKLINAIKEKKLRVDIDENFGRGRIIDQLYKQYVRPDLFQPCFLINHPIDISPLAKKHKDNPKITQRFHLLVAGAEIVNAFSELNDPIDQRERFEEQMKLREAGDEEAQMIDEDFIEALEIGMPPTSGFGMGIDRFFSILTNQESVRDVVFFPMMKPESEDKTNN
ncbi:lysine--tRNA ligase [Candidatus Woesearchaeota archaeon CG1_02_33_12]|nr:MAG: lysine--tRNA ligase [Candidatus Woesearchaeota archaeon CG1_02_33_12]PIN78389.1 MAG: lysine--tRNA ligase [Candidatus Woesearchaeota archaeon CG10_big_fil_rev_8_21_14_0_10_33_12]PIU72651.1 MAG: lysine--tRNA ligase [Candidatus Woesearchaeota archaeon CG06_land_8_20_14_3_00_33_13]